MESKDFPPEVWEWQKQHEEQIGHKVSIRFIDKAQSKQQTGCEIYIYPGSYRYKNILTEDIKNTLDKHYQQHNNINYQRSIQIDPFVVVCTHGIRDQCCAKYGQKFYQRLQELASNQSFHADVWQSTHLGGHRFAPTLIAYPTGHAYGHLQTEDIDTLCHHIEKQRVYAPRYRGCTWLTKENQIIEAAAQKYIWKNKQLWCVGEILQDKDQYVVTLDPLFDGICTSKTIRFCIESKNFTGIKSCHQEKSVYSRQIAKVI